MTKPKAINRKKLVAFVLLICKTDNCHGNLEIEYAGTGIREQAVIVHDVCERLLPENFFGRLRWSVPKKRRNCENQLASGLKQIVRQEYRGCNPLAGIQGC